MSLFFRRRDGRSKMYRWGMRLAFVGMIAWVLGFVGLFVLLPRLAVWATPRLAKDHGLWLDLGDASLDMRSGFVLRDIELRPLNPQKDSKADPARVHIDRVRLDWSLKSLALGTLHLNALEIEGIQGLGLNPEALEHWIQANTDEDPAAGADKTLPHMPISQKERDALQSLEPEWSLPEWPTLPFKIHIDRLHLELHRLEFRQPGLNMHLGPVVLEGHGGWDKNGPQGHFVAKGLAGSLADPKAVSVLVPAPVAVSTATAIQGHGTQDWQAQGLLPDFYFEVDLLGFRHIEWQLNAATQWSLSPLGPTGQPQASGIDNAHVSFWASGWGNLYAWQGALSSLHFDMGPGLEINADPVLWSANDAGISFASQGGQIDVSMAAWQDWAALGFGIRPYGQVHLAWLPWAWPARLDDASAYMRPAAALSIDALGFKALEGFEGKSNAALWPIEGLNSLRVDNLILHAYAELDEMHAMGAAEVDFRGGAVFQKSSQKSSQKIAEQTGDALWTPLLEKSLADLSLFARHIPMRQDDPLPHVEVQFEARMEGMHRAPVLWDTLQFELDADLDWQSHATFLNALNLDIAEMFYAGDDLHDQSPKISMLHFELKDASHSMLQDDFGETWAHRFDLGTGRLKLKDLVVMGFSGGGAWEPKLQRFIGKELSFFAAIDAFKDWQPFWRWSGQKPLPAAWPQGGLRLDASLHGPVSYQILAERITDLQGRVAVALERADAAGLRAVQESFSQSIGSLPFAAKLKWQIDALALEHPEGSLEEGYISGAFWSKPYEGVHASLGMKLNALASLPLDVRHMAAQMDMHMDAKGFVGKSVWQGDHLRVPQVLMGEIEALGCEMAFELDARDGLEMGLEACGSQVVGAWISQKSNAAIFGIGPTSILALQGDLHVPDPQSWLLHAWGVIPGLWGGAVDGDFKIAWVGPKALKGGKQRRQAKFWIDGPQLFGHAGLDVAIEGDADVLTFAGKSHATDLYVLFPDKGVKALTGVLPLKIAFAKRMREGDVPLRWDPKHPPLGLVPQRESKPQRSVMARRLRPYRRNPGLRADALFMGEHRLEKLSMDARLEGPHFIVDDAHFRSMQGEFAGAFSAWATADRGAHMAMQWEVSGLDAGSIADLDLPPGPKSEIHGTVKMQSHWSPKSRDIRLDAQLTRIGTRAFDSFLRALDPKGEDASLQETRKTLGLIRIKTVAMWVAYESLNIDLDYRTQLRLPGTPWAVPIPWFRPVQKQLLRRFSLSNHLDSQVAPIVAKQLGGFLDWPKLIDADQKPEAEDRPKEMENDAP